MCILFYKQQTPRQERRGPRGGLLSVSRGARGVELLSGLIRVVLSGPAKRGGAAEAGNHGASLFVHRRVVAGAAFADAIDERGDRDAVDHPNDQDGSEVDDRDSLLVSPDHMIEGDANHIHHTS